MAASASFMYIASPQNHHVQKGCSQHADTHHSRVVTPLHHRDSESSLRYRQHRAHEGRTLKCRSMHGAGAESEERFGEWGSEQESWRALKNQIEAFHGEFPSGAAASALQALVNKLDAVADSANPHMQILLAQAKRFLKCPRASLVHYLNVVRNTENSGHPKLCAWYLETGLACREAGDLEGALHFCSKAREASMQHFGPSSLRVAQARSALAKLYSNLARYKESIEQAQMARPILKESGSLPEIVSLELTMADTLFTFKRYDKVVSILKEVIDSTNGSLHIHANIMTARAYAAMGNNAETKAHCQKAFDGLDVQKPSAQAAAHYVMLASIYEEQGDFQQAALALKRSLTLYEKFPQHNPDDFVSELEGKLGRMLIQLKDAKEALPYLEKNFSKKQMAVGCLSKGESREAQELLHAQYYLGAAYSQCGKLDQALEHFEACIQLLSEVCKGENPSFVMTVYNNAACMHYHLDRLDKAIECQRAALDVVKKNKLQETSATKRIEALLERYLLEANS